MVLVSQSLVSMNEQNKMEPTNPNASMCSKTNTQIFVDTLVGDF